jgi:hypothetical protein
MGLPIAFPLWALVSPVPTPPAVPALVAGNIAAARAVTVLAARTVTAPAACASLLLASAAARFATTSTTPALLASPCAARAPRPLVGVDLQLLGQPRHQLVLGEVQLRETGTPAGECVPLLRGLEATDQVINRDILHIEECLN